MGLERINWIDYSNDSNGSWYPSYEPFCSRIQTYYLIGDKFGNLF